MSHAIDDGSQIAMPGAWQQLTGTIIAAAIEVHSALGPGLPERLYEEAMEIELSARCIPIQRQKTVQLSFKGQSLSPMVLDLVVAELVVIELKAVEVVHPAHLAQLVGYMRASKLPLGLLLNFNAPRLKDGLFRRINPDSPLFSTSEVFPPRSSVSSVYKS
jgi:GxxExxY protein